MKKTYALIIASVLGSSPLITYALPDYSDYLQEGSISENDDEKEEAEAISGIYWEDWKGPWKQLFYLPSNIQVVHDKVERLSLCGSNGEVMDDASIGHLMAPFTVKANITKGDGTALSNEATFAFPTPNAEIMTGGNNNGGGQAVATDGDELLWKLTQHGSQTWDNPWTIELGKGVTLHSIEIDLLSKSYGPKGGFDILLRPNDEKSPELHPSPGSGAGWPLQPKKPIGKSLSNVNYIATYSRPIVLPDGFLGDPGEHDMYGKVTIDFPDGITKNSTDVDLAFIFWTDTDCLPVEDVDVKYKGNGVATFTAIGDNMNLFVVKEGDIDVAGPFTVERENGNTITETVSGLEKDACYWIEDRNDNGHRELLYGPACVPMSK